MDPQRWNRINDLFFSALQVDDGERECFLAQSCGDDGELRAEVENLLAADADESVSRFLEPRTLEPDDDTRADELVGKTIGTYRIDELIGKGGMGNVYLARRVADYEQRVAIKLLKAGMDSEQILRRFRNEIQFLAALGKHPNIAALLDAGLTDRGLPYFVMEYVEGKRIDSYCDDNRLNTQQRLRLFRTVCDGVQFAHQHAIIHRDLKPSNILVTEDGIPKLIDFVISKLTDNSDEDHITQTEMRLLTPRYASPEHVQGQSVTTASDVYSLGVVLYELLTGRRPYEWTGGGLDVITR